jgi:hypothetical protein
MTTDPFTLVLTAWCVNVLPRSCLYNLFGQLSSRLI